MQAQNSQPALWVWCGNNCMLDTLWQQHANQGSINGWGRNRGPHSHNSSTRDASSRRQASPHKQQGLSFSLRTDRLRCSRGLCPDTRVPHHYCCLCCTKPAADAAGSCCPEACPPKRAEQPDMGGTRQNGHRYHNATQQRSAPVSDAGCKMPWASDCQRVCQRVCMHGGLGDNATPPGQETGQCNASRTRDWTMQRL
jgi:hypothetical protein